VQLGYEFARTAFLLLRGGELAVFDKFNAVVEDVPDDAAKAVGDRPDSLQVAKAG
jgi:hypothetical protein